MIFKKYFFKKIIPLEVFLKNKYPLLIIVILGLFPLFWYKSGYIIANGDLFPVWFNAKNTISGHFFIWEESFGGQISIWPVHLVYESLWFLLSSLTISTGFIQILFFVFASLGSGITMFFLALTLYKNKILALFAAIFYMFNFFVMFSKRNSSIDWILVFLPLLFTLYYKIIICLREKKYLKYLKKYSVFFLIVTVVLFSFISHSPSVMAIAILSFLIWAFLLLILSKGIRFKIVKFSSILFILCFLVNLWWLVPIALKYMPGGSTEWNTWGVDTGINTAAWVHQRASFLNIFRLNTIWSWTDEYFEYISVYKNPFLLFTVFVPFILFFIGLFSKNNKYRKFNLFLIVIVVFFLFMQKGLHPPLDKINLFFYKYFPGAGIFRDPSKFGWLILIYLSLSIGFSVDFLYSKIREKKSNLRNFVSFVFSGILIFILVISVWPLVNGRIFDEGTKKLPFPSHVKFPEYWYEASNWVNNKKLDMRIITTPNNTFYAMPFKWGIYGGDGFIKLLIAKDILNTEYGYKTSIFYNKIINTLFDGIKNNDKKTVFFLSGIMNARYFLQRDEIVSNPKMLSIGTLKNFFDSSSEVKKISSFTNLDFYQISDKYFLPHFYIPQNIIYANGGIEMLPDIVGSENYKIRSGIYLDENGEWKMENGKLLNRTDEVFVKAELKNAVTEEELEIVVKPEELHFPYVRWKPGNLVYSLVLKKEQFDKWEARKDPEKLIDKKLFYASKRISEIMAFGVNERVLINYKKEMMDALGILEKLKQEGSKDFVKLLAKYEGTLWVQREKIKEIENLTDWDNAFQELNGQAEELKIKRDFSKLVYNFEIPKSGNYSLFISKNQAPFIKGIDELTDYSLLGERNFGEGKQELVLPLGGISENLVDENLRIKDYSPNSIYRISFEYQAPRGGSFFVAEGKTGETAETQLSSTGDEFRHFEMYFKSSPEVQEAAILLSISVSEEKNLKIEKIYQPEIILKSDTRDVIRGTEQIPRITFVKINPTKYRIKVEGAVNPYTLIFSESFHQGWKAYVSGQPFDSAQGEQSAISNQYGGIVTNYFEGDIKEGTHKNIFLDKNTFETWGKKPISEDKHLLINGYANSWYITPEDAGGRQDYELIIEFAPQKLFYIGLFISVITLIGCLIYLLCSSIVRKNRQ